uniref:Uncharacterized protein n=1 Tax=Prymnesium polylepis TaxID=72548 RepID=A0A6V4SKI3_9EUKA|mmetsp:Transcript_28545/g.77279  ORF Transcript_28545/g.77279 Transcript_28545/m.77279 type:complete len:148 (-) Transcript_28545:1063-1506(-)
MARIPATMNFEGKEVALHTFGQLEQLPRQRLKNRAMDLRDMVGADRLPHVNVGGTIDTVISWILDVQCALAKSAGIELTPEALGKPHGYGLDEDGMAIGGKGGGAQRQPMQDVVQGGGGGEGQTIYEDNSRQAAAIRQRNRGSNIFG